MKKRFFAFTLTALMAFASATAVYAEEETEVTTAAIELNWSDFEEEVAGSTDISGDFVVFEEVSAKMFLPDIFEAQELTEEDIEKHFIGYFTMGDDAHIGVQLGDMDGMGLDEYADMIATEYGVTDVVQAVINGNDCIAYTMPDNESMGVVAFGTNNGYILGFTFSPINDEDFESVFGIIMASIQSV